MRIEIQDYKGSVYRPLDLFKGVNVNYNLSYKSAHEINSYRMPYTDKFNIPASETNKDLLGAENASEMLRYGTNRKGRVYDDDGELLFYCRIIIEKADVLKLNEQFSIAIIDELSYMISKMKEDKISDLFYGINLRSSYFGTFGNLYFALPMLNFNNKETVFAFNRDAEWAQMVPTLKIKRLIDALKRHGINIKSNTLTTPGMLLKGIDPDNIGLMLPTVLKKKSSIFNMVLQDTSSWDDTKTVWAPISSGYAESNTLWGRLPGTRRSETTGNIDGLVKKEYGCKGSSCLATGSANATMSLNGGTFDIIYEFDSNMPVTNVNVQELDLVAKVHSTYNEKKCSAADDEEEEKEVAGNTSYTEGIAIAKVDSIEKVSGKNAIVFHCVQDNDAEQSNDFGSKLEFLAGSEFALTFTLNGKAKMTLGTSTFEISKSFGRVYNNSKPIKMAAYISAPVDIKLDFSEKGIGFAFDNSKDQEFSLSTSFKAHGDMSIFELVSFVMQRFNLVLFSRGDQIMIEREVDMRIGEEEIDDLVNGNDTYNYNNSEYKYLTFSDENPSFYPKMYNALKQLEYNSESDSKEYTVKRKGCITKENLFKDTYNSTGLDLLKYYNNPDFWGIATIKQEKITSFKPMFMLLKEESVKPKVYVPEVSTYTRGMEVERIVQFTPNKFLATNAKTARGVVEDNGVSLLDFHNNEILTGETIFNTRFSDTIASSMSNISMSINVSAYISPDRFRRMLLFPYVMYAGSKWALEGLENYKISNPNGSICTLKLTKDIKQPPETPSRPTLSIRDDYYLTARWGDIFNIRGYELEVVIGGGVTVKTLNTTRYDYKVFMSENVSTKVRVRAYNNFGYSSWSAYSNSIDVKSPGSVSRGYNFIQGKSSKVSYPGIKDINKISMEVKIGDPDATGKITAPIFSHQNLTVYLINGKLKLEADGASGEWLDQECEYLCSGENWLCEDGCSEGECWYECDDIYAPDCDGISKLSTYSLVHNKRFRLEIIQITDGFDVTMYDFETGAILDTFEATDSGWCLDDLEGDFTLGRYKTFSTGVNVILSKLKVWGTSGNLVIDAPMIETTGSTSLNYVGSNGIIDKGTATDAEFFIEFADDDAPPDAPSTSIIYGLESTESDIEIKATGYDSRANAFEAEILLTNGKEDSFIKKNAINSMKFPKYTFDATTEFIKFKVRVRIYIDDLVSPWSTWSAEKSTDNPLYGTQPPIGVMIGGGSLFTEGYIYDGMDFRIAWSKAYVPNLMLRARNNFKNSYEGMSLSDSISIGDDKKLKIDLDTIVVEEWWDDDYDDWDGVYEYGGTMSKYVSATNYLSNYLSPVRMPVAGDKDEMRFYWQGKTEVVTSSGKSYEKLVRDGRLSNDGIGTTSVNSYGSNFGFVAVEFTYYDYEDEEFIYVNLDNFVVEKGVTTAGNSYDGYFFGEYAWTKFYFKLPAGGVEEFFVYELPTKGTSIQTRSFRKTVGSDEALASEPINEVSKTVLDEKENDMFVDFANKTADGSINPRITANVANNCILDVKTLDGVTTRREMYDRYSVTINTPNSKRTILLRPGETFLLDEKIEKGESIYLQVDKYKYGKVVASYSKEFVSDFDSNFKENKMIEATNVSINGSLELDMTIDYKLVDNSGAMFNLLDIFQGGSVPTKVTISSEGLAFFDGINFFKIGKLSAGSKYRLVIKNDILILYYERKKLYSRKLSDAKEAYVGDYTVRLYDNDNPLIGIYVEDLDINGTSII